MRGMILFRTFQKNYNSEKLFYPTEAERNQKLGAKIGARPFLFPRYSKKAVVRQPYFYFIDFIQRTFR